MKSILPRNLCGWMLACLACLMILVSAGCGRKSVRRNGEPGAAAAGITSSQTVWRQVVISGAIPRGEGKAAELSRELVVSVDLDSPDAGLSAIEVERMDRRERARHLAETRIDRARTEMQNASTARLDALRREMQAENDSRLNDLKSRIAADHTGRMREAELQLQREIMNLNLKMFALKARQGMFGGELDVLTGEALDKLTVQREELDKRRNESIQSAKERRDGEIAQVSRRLQDEMEQNLSSLKVELNSRLEDQSKSLRDRMQAQMSGGWRSVFDSNVSVVSVDDVGRAPRALDSLHERAIGDADARFEKDIAEAISIARRKLEQARLREAEDAALAARTISGA